MHIHVVRRALGKVLHADAERQRERAGKALPVRREREREADGHALGDVVQRDGREEQKIAVHLSPAAPPHELVEQEERQRAEHDARRGGQKRRQT